MNTYTEIFVKRNQEYTPRGYRKLACHEVIKAGDRFFLERTITQTTTHKPRWIVVDSNHESVGDLVGNGRHFNMYRKI